VHVDQRRAPHDFILWAGPPLMARPMYIHKGIRGYTPTKRAGESEGGEGTTR
jgi:hypothetical protein